MSIMAKEPRLIYKDKIYRPAPWSFHAILIIDGLVLDLDFTDIPQVLPFAEYIRRMWGESRFEYYYQLKPAVDYGGSDLFGLFEEEIYPSQKFSEIKSQLVNMRCFK